MVAVIEARSGLSAIAEHGVGGGDVSAAARPVVAAEAAPRGRLRQIDASGATLRSTIPPVVGSEEASDMLKEMYLLSVPLAEVVARGVVAGGKRNHELIGADGPLLVPPIVPSVSLPSRYMPVASP